MSVSGKAVMRIGVISDTHFNQVQTGLAFMQSLMAGPFSGIDMLLHAGDLVRDEILDTVTDCPVFAVRGNMDAQSRYPHKRVISAGRFRIGLIHGWGAPGGLEQRLLNEFADQQIDVLVYGHSHLPACRRSDDIMLFNPGSATDRRDAPHHTIGLLHLADDIRGELIHLD